MSDPKVVRMTLQDIDARQFEDLRQRDPGLVARIEAQDRLVGAAPEMLRALLWIQREFSKGNKDPDYTELHVKLFRVINKATVDTE